VSQHGRVLTVQDEAAVHHVQEQTQVLGPVERGRHRPEQHRDQLELAGGKCFHDMQSIQTKLTS